MADCAKAGEATLAKALDAARASFDRGDLADMNPSARGRLMIRIAQEIRAIALEGAQLLCRESG
jgi:aldehyde dehydrogenase (NAD+)